MSKLTLTPAELEQLGCSPAEGLKLLAHRSRRKRAELLAELKADLETLRREERNRAQRAAQAAIVWSTEQPNADEDVLILHLSSRSMTLVDATVNGPAVALRNLGASYLPLATVRGLPETWTRRHQREMRERSLLVVHDVLTRDPLVAILEAIKSPLQDAGGRERHDFEASNDRVIATQHLAALLSATRDKARLERWLNAAGEAPHAAAIDDHLTSLFGRGSSGGLGYTTSAHSVGIKGI